MASTRPAHPFTLMHCSWPQQRDALMRVRFAVFVDEQGVPANLELDEHDPVCQHVLVCDPDGEPVGAGRIKPDGQLGRMAVLKEARGQGIGSAILGALIDDARQQGRARVFLHAQQSAVSFYQRHGFETRGEPFEEAGIPHRTMEKRLD